MPKLPGVNHLNAVRALEKAGFWIARHGQAYRDDGRKPNRNDSATQSSQRNHDGQHYSVCRVDQRAFPQITVGACLTFKD